MANTATITKGSVTKSDGYYNVSVNVVINDGTTDIIDTSVSARYVQGTAPSTVTGRLQAKIKDVWDKYVAEQAIYNAAALDTAIGTMSTQLNTYINA